MQDSDLVADPCIEEVRPCTDGKKVVSQVFGWLGGVSGGVTMTLHEIPRECPVGIPIPVQSLYVRTIFLQFYSKT